MFPPRVKALTAAAALFLLAVPGGGLGAAALRGVRACSVSRSRARSGLSVRLWDAPLRAPVGRVEELVEGLRQDPVPPNAAPAERRRGAGGAGVPRRAFHRDLSPPRARPAVSVHVLSAAVGQTPPAVVPFTRSINAIISESDISHGRDLRERRGLVRVRDGVRGLALAQIMRETREVCSGHVVSAAR